jgi:hypothetical protein
LAILLTRTQPLHAEERKPTTSETSRGPTTWLVATGGVIFGGSYLISFGMASAGAGCGNAFLGMDCVPRNNVPGSDWPLFIPVAGPFVAMATSEDRPTYALAILGATQIVGAALIISGFAVRTAPEPTARVSFSPSIDKSGARFFLSSRF